MPNSGGSKHELTVTAKKQNKTNPLIAFMLYFYAWQDTQRLENIKSLNLNLYTVNATNFDVIALQFFHYQAENNPVYRNYLHHLKVDHAKIESINSIPFLPISFFKSNTIKTGNWESQTLFESSATTGQVTSKHEVKNLSFYLHHAARCFEFFFG